MEERNQPTGHEPLALIGIGCRLPGGICDTESLWQLLIRGESGLSDVPADRWNSDRYYHEDPNAIGNMIAKRGGFVDKLKQFDASFFGFSPREAVRLDPQQRWMLETAWEACEDAGIAPSKLRGSNIGVYIGASSHDYGSLQLNDLANLDVHSNTGGALSIIANRISYFFDLQGPSLSIDTACSSALVAVSMACHSIWSGECEAAFAGGVNALVTPNSSIGFSKASMLSPSGECYAFDQRADGYVRAEGAGIVLLKPLRQAIANGDRIYAAIRSAVVNQDGRTSSMTVPSADRQSELLRKALHKAGAKAKDVRYVEAHGTGTPVGDPIEATAIGRVMSEGRDRDDPCLIGSIKANLGHLEPASGIAGLIKVALMLDRNAIPASRNFDTPNPEIPFNELKLQVVDRLIPVPSKRPSREGACFEKQPVTSEVSGGLPCLMAINSFGFGGTNASAVLQSVPPAPVETAVGIRENLAREHVSATRLSHTHSRNANRPYVLPISASDETALRNYVHEYANCLDNPQINLADFCYSAGARKQHHDLRLIATGADAPEMSASLRKWLQGEECPKIDFDAARLNCGKRAFVFTGQGSQWATMGRDLIANEPIVAESIAEIDEYFKNLSGWSLKAEMLRSAEESKIHATRVAQPAIFAIQVAVVRLWESWGILPDSVVGHSVGEVAAALCAGIYSLEQAVALVYHRSRLQDTTVGTGRMLAAGISPCDADAWIQSDALEVTAINSPSLLTFGGPSDAILELERQLRREGKFVKDLGLDYAFHTKQMDAIKGPLLDALDFLTPQQSRIPFFSTVTGEEQSGELMDAGYWWQNVRQPVMFQRAIQSLFNADHSVFLEVGPHPALRTSIQECIAEQQELDSEAGQPDEETTICHSLTRDADSTSALMRNVAQLHFAGQEINWQSLNQSDGNLVSQPRYPWSYEDYWLDEGFDADRCDAVLHPFLGRRLKSAAPTWEFKLDLCRFGYLADHKIWDGNVFPASGFAEIGFAVAKELFGEESYAVEELQCLEALFIDDAAPTVQVAFDESTSTFSIHSSIDGKSWKTNAVGRLVAWTSSSSTPSVDVSSIQKRLSDKLLHDDLYKDLHQLGYGFGNSFSLIQAVWHNADALHNEANVALESLACVNASKVELGAFDQYRSHPTLLDACFQSTHGVGYRLKEKRLKAGLYLPESIRRVHLHVDRLPQEFWVHAVQISADIDFAEYDLDVIDFDGQAIAEIRGFRVARVSQAAGSNPLDDYLYQFKWEAQAIDSERVTHSSPLPANRAGSFGRRTETGSQAATLIFAGPDRVSQELTTRLRQSSPDTICIQLGEKFQRTSENGFTVVDGSLDELMKVSELANLPMRNIQQVLHCWCLFQSPESAPVSAQGISDAQRLGVTSALNLTKSLEVLGVRNGARIAFVTRNAQCTSVYDTANGIGASSLVGFCRVAISEKPECQWQVIDLDGEAEAAESNADVQFVLDELENACSESEIAFRDGTRLVNRLQRVKFADIPQRVSSLTEADISGIPVRLQMQRAGVIEELSLHETTRREPKAREIEVRVLASGINFRDVMKALAVYPGESKDLLQFGDDFAGVVERVGSEVKGLTPGDRVCGIADYCFQSYVAVDHRMTFKLPNELSFDQASSLPTAFLTAHLAINKIARARAGERILIHAAAGGVGQAAVQIAQHLGLEIFATAGTPEKRAWLRQQGVAHVLDSRSLQFAKDALEITHGAGVDVVLNSLAGEFIPKSLSVLAPFGRFLEIGKVDVYGNSKLGLAALKNNISYHVIDLAQIIEQRPAEAAAMLRELGQRFITHDYVPLPIRVFPVAKASEAFRFMAKGSHIGKNVLSFAHVDAVGEESQVEIGPCTEEGQLFKNDASYLLVGGARGFGFEVAKWMVHQGARHLAILSRSGPSASVAAQIAQMSADGIEIVDLRGDVTQMADVQDAVSGIQSSMPNLKGVLHAAMVLDDDFIMELDEERLCRALNPKVLGAWNLHQATLASDLDHFICFSSFSAVIGAPKQANYNAGNSFLDAFAAFRRAKGLPALTVNWGAIQGAGVVARDRKTAEYLESVGLRGLGIDEALEILSETISRDPACLVAAPADWSRIGKVNKAITSLPLYSKVATTYATTGSRWPLQNALGAVVEDHWYAVVEDFLAQQVAGVFGIAVEDVDCECPLTTMGIDSLMAVELMNRVDTGAGVSIPMRGLLGGPSIRELSSLLLPEIAKLMDGFGSERSDLAFDEHVAADESDFANDSLLGESIRPVADNNIKPAVERLLLTGATGFLGAHLLAEMLDRTDAAIVCLVRAQAVETGMQRVLENLRSYSIDTSDVDERVEIVIGDMAEENLGLSDEQFTRLARSVDVIYHNAADVNLALPYSELRQANVFGTKEILRLACQERTKPIHYVSTFMVHGTDALRGVEVSELDSLPNCEELRYGYAQTKWVSETMLEAARRRGVPVAIYRPGHVTGHSETGAANVNDLLHTFVRACLLAQATPLESLELDVSPVDYVAKAMFELSLQSSAIGRNFHLTNPHPLTDERVASWMNGEGATINRIPYEQWRERIETFALKGSKLDETFGPIVQTLMQQLSHGSERGIHPRFSCEETLSALADSGIACPAADEHLLSKCYGYLQETGVVPYSEAKV